MLEASTYYLMVRRNPFLLHFSFWLQLESMNERNGIRVKKYYSEDDTGTLGAYDLAKQIHEGAGSGKYDQNSYRLFIAEK